VAKLPSYEPAHAQFESPLTPFLSFHLRRTARERGSSVPHSRARENTCLPLDPPVLMFGLFRRTPFPLSGQSSHSTLPSLLDMGPGRAIHAENDTFTLARSLWPSSSAPSNVIPGRRNCDGFIVRGRDARGANLPPGTMSAATFCSPFFTILYDFVRRNLLRRRYFPTTVTSVAVVISEGREVEGVDRSRFHCGGVRFAVATSHGEVAREMTKTTTTTRRRRT